MAKKRGNNEGSLYKRSNGTWRAQVTVEGKRLNHTAETKRECQAWLRETLEEVDNGLTYESAQVTLKDYIEGWLVSTEPSVRFNTIKQYRQVCKQHILPHLGKVTLRELKPEHVQQLYNRMVARGYGFRTVELTHSVIHRALVQAVKLGVIARNPAAATTPPKPTSAEMQFLDETQAVQFLVTARANDDRFFALYHLAISTGMRQGELLGLKWADVDFRQSTLQVQRQLTKKKGGGYEFTAPKTKAGIRNIDIGQTSVTVLQEHQKAQFEQIRAAGERWQDNDLVFPSEIGTPYDRDNLRRRFKMNLKDAGLPEVRFHDLRHTAASLMLNNGVPVIVVSRRLGHSKPSVTLDIYGHLIPSKQRVAARLMDELLTPIQVEMSEQISPVAPRLHQK